jgi:hypothetical protein
VSRRGDLVLQSPPEFLTRQSLPFVFVTAGSILYWIFAPDDFGKSHGSFLRERILLCGLICFVPLFRAGKVSRLPQRAAVVLLVLIVFFQTAALWEYALNADALAKEYLAARPVISDDDRFASINFIETAADTNPTRSLISMCFTALANGRGFGIITKSDIIFFR